MHVCCLRSLTENYLNEYCLGCILPLIKHLADSPGVLINLVDAGDGVDLRLVERFLGIEHHPTIKLVQQSRDSDSDSDEESTDRDEGRTRYFSALRVVADANPSAVTKPALDGAVVLDTARASKLKDLRHWCVDAFSRIFNTLRFVLNASTWFCCDVMCCVQG
eukprot:COSAG06_NODE_2536_length_6709_cov_42.478669_4_plen_163_part_00